MDMSSEISEETGIQNLNPTSVENWVDGDENVNSSTLLYISVEYIKNEKSENDENAPSQLNPQETYTDFVTPQVSPLDPNMSSVARYSPVPVQYQKNSSNQLGPIIIHQYVTQEDNMGQDGFVNHITAESSLEDISAGMPTALCNNDIQSPDLEMVENDNVNICNNESMQLGSEGEQQGVELVITDHTTGISYSVNAQELLVERCLEDDQQLLEAIAPNPILESDLLSLDEGILKSELNTEAVNSTVVTSVNDEVINNYINCLSNKNGYCDNKMQTRSTCSSNIDEEEQLLSCVYSIMDKPILTRARASLPELYLSISKINGENAVYAKRAIPKKTQFGPLEGVLVQEKISNITRRDKSLNYLIMVEGNVYSVDVSNENTSNWMGFVRNATKYEEQNLILSQDGNGLYFTTTRVIPPKKELKVGYSTVYARQFNLDVIKSIENKTWPCYECSDKFGSSEDLQKHLSFHDQEKDENTKPKRKYKRKFLVLTKSQVDMVECNMCHEPFSSNVNYHTLRKHLGEKHKCTTAKTGDYFSVYQCFQCDCCDMRFRMEILLNIHKLEHDPDLSLVQTNHVCPQCQRKCPTRKQLVLHVTNHALPKEVIKEETFKCKICYKIFAHSERLQKHMLVHGSEEAKPLQCKYCKKRFLTNSALAFHVKIHFAGQKIFECPICKERFDHVLKLRLHVPKHAHNNQYTCPHCKKVFNKYRILRKHIRLHGEPKFSCVHCPKMFTTPDILKKHMLKHSDHYEFLCSDCGRQFKRKDKLKEHIKKLHMNEKKNCNEKVLKRKIRTPSKVEPTDFHRFIYKCHTCLVGFKRRGMLVNHLAKRHPDIRPDSVPELNLPILQTTKDYYCQYCEKVYKSSSKRKVHILKNHPGAALPVNSREKANGQTGVQSGSYSQTVRSVTTRPKNCQWCHKQYASKARLLKHIRKDHPTKFETEPCLNENHGKDDCSLGENALKITLAAADDSKNFVKSKKADNPSEINSDNAYYNETSMDQHNHPTTDGTMSEITTTGMDTFVIDDDSKYCHLSSDENKIIIAGEELENHNTHLYHLLTSNNDMAGHKKNTKAKAVADKKYETGTGGGPVITSKIDPTDTKVLDLNSPKATFGDCIPVPNVIFDFGSDLELKFDHNLSTNPSTLKPEEPQTEDCNDENKMVGNNEKPTSIVIRAVTPKNKNQFQKKRFTKAENIEISTSISNNLVKIEEEKKIEP